MKKYMPAVTVIMHIIHEHQYSIASASHMSLCLRQMRMYKKVVYSCAPLPHADAFGSVFSQ
jgi:hypothetical protein